MKSSFAGAVGLVLALATPAASTEVNTGATGPVIPRDTVAYGRTYGDWAAAWWQWALSIPATAHPLFETADCSTGQKEADTVPVRGATGPVFFIGGKFCRSGDNSCSGTATRSCTVPSGKAIFFPVLNSEDSTLEESTNPTSIPGCGKGTTTGLTINCLRLATQANIDPTTNLVVEVDGERIHDLKTKFRVQSPAFDITLPTSDNVLNAIGEGPYNGGMYSPSVDDGIYVMLAPLSTGKHKLHITGTFPQFTPHFVVDITYNLTVK